MKKEKFLCVFSRFFKMTAVITALIITLASCKKEPSTTTKPTPTTYSIDLTDPDSPIFFWDNLDYLNFQQVINLNDYFSEKWPEAGDKVTITYNATSSASIPAVYCNIVDNSEKANYWMLLAEEEDSIFAENLQENKHFSTTITFTFDRTPLENVCLQLFYWAADFCNIAYFYTNEPFLLGEASPATCDFIADVKNTTTHPISVIAHLWFDDSKTFVNISKPKTILPNGSTRFYCDLAELEAKYGTKLYSDDTYFWCQIIQPPFKWTDSSKVEYTWGDPYMFWAGSVKPVEVKDKIFTCFITAKNEYNESTNEYTHNYYENPDNSVRDITEEDRSIPNLPFTNTRVQFDYNAYGLNYQTSIQTFNEPLKTGEKYKLSISGVPEDSIKELSVCITDISPQANYWRVLSKEAENKDNDPSSIKNLTANESFNYEYTFEIVNDSVAFDLSQLIIALKYEIDDLDKVTSIKNCTISVKKL